MLFNGTQTRQAVTNIERNQQNKKQLKYSITFVK